jgi:hypothetical protein
MKKTVADSTSPNITDAKKNLSEIAKDKLMLKLWQSGRELFHSNMLAYLIEDSDFSPNVLHYLIEGRQMNAEKSFGLKNFHIRVWREYKHMDLWIMALPPIMKAGICLDPDKETYWCEWANEIKLEESTVHPWHLIVIENKFKSLPDWAQLYRYSAHLVNDRPTLGWLKKYWQQGSDQNDSEEGVIGVGPHDDLNIQNKMGEFPVDRGITLPTHSSNQLNASSASKKNIAGERSKPSREGHWIILQASDPCSEIEDAITINLKGQRAKERSKSYKWERRYWNEIAKCIESSTHAKYKGRVENYMQHTVASNSIYVDPIAFLSSYKNIISRACTVNTLISKLTKQDFGSLDNLRNEANKYKLHDFTEKWRYSWLGHVVKRQLFVDCCDAKTADAARRPAQIGKKIVEGFDFKVCDTGEFWIQITPFFSRGTGGVDINIHDAKKVQQFSIGLQLQSHMLKIYVTVPTSSATVERAGAANNHQEEKAIKIIQKVICSFGNYDRFEHLRSINVASAEQKRLYRYNQKLQFLEQVGRSEGELHRLSVTNGTFFYFSWMAWHTLEGRMETEQEKVIEMWQGKSIDIIGRDLSNMVRCITDRWEEIVLTI